MDSARVRFLRWTLFSKWNKEVMISLAGLNQKPSDMRYRASRIAPLRCYDMLEWEEVGPQYVVDKEHTRGELSSEKDRSCCCVSG